MLNVVRVVGWRLSFVCAMGIASFQTEGFAQEAAAEPEGKTAPVVVQHRHFDNKHHGTTLDAKRFMTNRDSRVDLPLPEEKDAFVFGVFGDRTGGQPEGIEVLKQAVSDVNLFEPDLVMTVGDLVQGYNDKPSWMAEMREYKSCMQKLLCPWFPVAGNHDIYFRGPNPPEGEHEENYEMHFGPLWYAFKHKECWFIVLYSDEGNPETGEKAISKPESQKMSPEQFTWLKKTLGKTKDSEHVFVFLHHPRWLGGNYGNDWDKVHKALVDSGNVRIVFAGHIHRMRYDGPKDGIEYVTLATVGGGQSGVAPAAGFLHQYHLVTVRKKQIAMACLPVGAVMDVRKITGEMSDEIRSLTASPPKFTNQPRIQEDGMANEPCRVELFNPTSRPVEFTARVDSEDRRWLAKPDHLHQKLSPGQRVTIALTIRHAESLVDGDYHTPELVLDADYLAPEARIPIEERRIQIPIRIPIQPSTDVNRAVTTGSGNCLRVGNGLVDLPDGPMTLECWFRAKSFAGRTALMAKTEQSEYGIFVSGGLPYFSVHLDGRYHEPQSSTTKLTVGKWHHVAGVFDGKEVSTYLDGKRIASAPAAGKRTTNGLPLIVGGDVDGNGKAVSLFDGEIDSMRLSKVARYSGESIEPSKSWSADDDTCLLLNMNEFVGPFAIDESPNAAHATKVGKPELVKVAD